MNVKKTLHVQWAKESFQLQAVVHMMIVHPANDDNLEQEPSSDELQQENRVYEGIDAAFRIRWLNEYKKNSLVQAFWL